MDTQLSINEEVEGTLERANKVGYNWTGKKLGTVVNYRCPVSGWLSP